MIATQINYRKSQARPICRYNPQILDSELVSVLLVYGSTRYAQYFFTNVAIL